MGEVKDAVQGDGKNRKTKTSAEAKDAGANIRQDLVSMRDEISDYINIKDEDARTEGDKARPENERKAALLRAAHSLVTAAERILEGY